MVRTTGYSTSGPYNRLEYAVKTSPFYLYINVFKRNILKLYPDEDPPVNLARDKVIVNAFIQRYKSIKSVTIILKLRNTIFANQSVDRDRYV